MAILSGEELNKIRFKAGDIFILKNTNELYNTIVTVLEAKEEQYYISWWNEERTKLFKTHYTDFDLKRYTECDEWEYYPVKN